MPDTVSETWLITGATRGIGLEMTRQLLARGNTVIATSRTNTPSALTELAIGAPGRLTIKTLDLRDGPAIDRLGHELAEIPVGVLVNNAGIFGPERQSALDTDFDGFAETFAVNTLAPLHVAQALLPSLRQSRRPRIVTISSQMGQMSSPTTGYVAYRASKAAANKAMQLLAADVAPMGICVTCLHPGWVRTDMGGPGADIAVDTSVRGLIQVIDVLDRTCSGCFFDWRGEPLAW